MSNDKNLLIKPLQPSQKHIQVKKKKKYYSKKNFIFKSFYNKFFKNIYIYILIIFY